MAYNGTGAARLVASISYSKQMTVSDSGITFKLLDFSSSINSNITGEYFPSTNDSATFNKLLQNNITN